MAATDPIIILIADDHTLLRECIRRELEIAGGFAVVGEAGDGDEAVRLTRRLRPEILLLDLLLPGRSGFDVAQTVRATCPETRIVVLTGLDEDDAAAVAMLGLGVHGYLSKGVRVQELTTALRAVHGGQRYVEPGMAQRLASRLDVADGHRLTPREMEILELLAQGLRDRDIADRLSLSPRTARFHVGNLRRKLGARTRAEAVVRARERRPAGERKPVESAR
jgi:DNA-binding NarL/FixJ family response regulator